MLALFRASQVLNVCNEGFSARETLILRAAQNTCSKSWLNWNILRREVLPEKGHEVGAIRPLQRCGQAGLVINVSRHHLRTGICKYPGFRGIDVPGNCPRGETSARVAHDRAHQSATLGTGGTHNRNDPFV